MIPPSLFEMAGRKLGFKSRELEGGILLLTRIVDPAKPFFLVMAGFHGIEEGGPHGVLRFLRTVETRDLDKLNLSIIPQVNSETDTYTNSEHLNPNNTGIHGVQKRLAWQSKALLNHFDLLKKLAKDGFLTLHEDEDQKRFYVYSFGDKNHWMAERIRDWGDSVFGVVKDSTSKKPDSGARGTTRDGIIKDKHDGSFEDLMSHAGTPFSVVTETPMKAPLFLRARVNALTIALASDMLVSGGPTC